MDAGATSVAEPADQFYGDRLARGTDVCCGIFTTRVILYSGLSDFGLDSLFRVAFVLHCSPFDSPVNLQHWAVSVLASIRRPLQVKGF